MCTTREKWVSVSWLAMSNRRLRSFSVEVPSHSTVLGTSCADYGRLCARHRAPAACFRPGHAITSQKTCVRGSEAVSHLRKLFLLGLRELRSRVHRVSCVQLRRDNRTVMVVSIFVVGAVGAISCIESTR